MYLLRKYYRRGDGVLVESNSLAAAYSAASTVEATWSHEDAIDASRVGFILTKGSLYTCQEKSLSTDRESSLFKR